MQIEFDGAEESAAAVTAYLDARDAEAEPARPTLEQVLAARRPVEVWTRPTRSSPAYRYVAGPHNAPNHAMRRAAKLEYARQERRFGRWWARMLRLGINSEDVLAARRARLLKEKALGQSGVRAATGDADRGAGELPADVSVGHDDAQLAS